MRLRPGLNGARTIGAGPAFAAALASGTGASGLPHGPEPDGTSTSAFRRALPRRSTFRGPPSATRTGRPMNRRDC